MPYGYVPANHGLQPQHYCGQRESYGGHSGGGYTQFHHPLSPQIAPLPGARMGQAVKRFFQRYAQFRGYASPSEFWRIFLPIVVFDQIVFWAIFIPALGNLMAASSVAADRNPAAAESAVAAAQGVWPDLPLVLVLVFHLLILLPLLSLMVRRLRDSGTPVLCILLLLEPSVTTILLVLFCLPSRPDRYRPDGT